MGLEVIVPLSFSKKLGEMYITDLKCISPQETYADDFIKGSLSEINSSTYLAKEPNYLEFIPKGLLRRMGKAVRMGIGTGLPLVQAHQNIDGILIGTANGGLEDCIKFLNQIVEYDEGTLTPTNFVQSTPNAVAGQLALLSKNHSYNITYTNGGTSFENTLLDALLLFEENNANKLLVGGLEEISDYNYNIDFLANKYKTEPISTKNILHSETKGTVCGEGSSMFILEKKAEKYYAQILDVEQITYPTEDDIHTILTQLLKHQGLALEDISSVMLGYNGDKNHNSWYDFVGNELLPNSDVYTFKQLVGDYRTVSSFAVWLSAQILSEKISKKESLLIRKKNVQSNAHKKYHLIYNHFDGVRHGFILLSR